MSTMPDSDLPVSDEALAQAAGGVMDGKIMDEHPMNCGCGCGGNGGVGGNGGNGGNGFGGNAGNGG